MDWRNQHRIVQKQLLAATSPDKDLALKGGTALMECYGLNRFSEYLDFDACHQGIDTIKHFSTIAKSYNYECNVKKDTNTVQRVLIDYGGAKSLKIETSFRRKNIPRNELVTCDGILTYNIEQLAIMKSSAYSGRDKIRDLFDLVFIVNTYFDELSAPTQSIIRQSLSYKGMEQFDFLTTDQHDELIEPGALLSNMVNAFDKLGLAQ